MGQITEILMITERTRIFHWSADVDASKLPTGDRIVAQAVRTKSAELGAREVRSIDNVERLPSSPIPSTGGH
jgi:hypothetical protein